MAISKSNLIPSSVIWMIILLVGGSRCKIAVDSTLSKAILLTPPPPNMPLPKYSDQSGALSDIQVLMAVFAAAALLISIPSAFLACRGIQKLYSDRKAKKLREAMVNQEDLQDTEEPPSSSSSGVSEVSASNMMHQSNIGLAKWPSDPQPGPAHFKAKPSPAKGFLLAYPSDGVLEKHQSNKKCAKESVLAYPSNNSPVDGIKPENSKELYKLQASLNKNWRSRELASYLH